MAVDFASSPYYDNSSTPVTAAPLTLVCWYNPDNTSTTQGIFGIFDTGGANDWLMINQQSGGTVSAYAKRSTNAQAASASTPSTGVWHHVAAVFASSTSRTCYLDGTAGTEETTSVSPLSLDSITIGRYGDSTPGSALNAQLAECAIYNVALSQEEISALAAGAKPKHVRPDALVAYYPMYDATGGGNDELGGYDLTVTGSPSDSEHPHTISIGAIVASLGGGGGGGDTVTLTDVDDYRVIARAADGNGDITISGTYTGTPTNIEYRLVDHGTTTPVTGHDWQTLEAGPTGGTFSGTVSNIPAGGWYNVDVRFSNDVSVTDDGTNRWGVGALVGVIGQSNARRFFESFTSYTATETFSQYTGTTAIGESTGVWAAPASNGVRKCGDVVVGVIGVPVGFIKFGVGSTALNTDSDSGSGYWLDTSASSVYDDFQAFVNTNGGTLDAIVWSQGETEALNGEVDAGRYKTDLATLRTNIAGDISPANGLSTIPFVVAQTARDTRAGSAGSDLEYAEVHRGQRLYTEANSDAYLAVLIDVGLSDGVHYDSGGFQTMGERVAHALLEAWSETATFPHPTITQWATVTATTLDVTISHGDGSDFTPTSAITGFEVEVDGVWESPSAAVRQTATSVRLTHSSGTVGAVRYMFGRQPTITSDVVDNTALNLTLTPNEDITAAAAGGADAVLVSQGLHGIESGITA